MKKYLSLFCFVLMINACFIQSLKSTKVTNSVSLKNKEVINSVSNNKRVNSNLNKNAKKATQAVIDGLGTNASTSANSAPLVLDKAPFKVTECNQILTFPAKYIIDLKDYRQRNDAYYVINVLSIYMFQKKDPTKLIHSANFTQVNKLTQALKGARGCIIVDGGSVTADITLCFDDESATQNILDAINAFSKCRMGDNLVPIPEEKIKELAQACQANEQKKSYSMNLDIRSDNKWDSDRAKFFQPSAITVPGTPPVLPENDQKTSTTA